LIAELERSFAALDARLNLVVDWRGASLDRLIDEGHARLSGLVAEYLGALGWWVEVEVTFAHFSERGSIDLLAWHAASRTLLVVEIKTELASIEGLLRPLDVKVRQSWRVARERFGWQPLTVARVVVLPESSATRRAVARHSSVLTAGLPSRSSAVREWTANPRGTISGLWVLSSASAAGLKRNPSAIRRVRKGRQATGERDCARRPMKTPPRTDFSA
jgi:hypothetical protein